MRRKDREIADREEIDDILRANSVCSLAMIDGGVPYVVPLTYGYDGRCLYIHSAREGRKVGALRRDGRVCFSVHDSFQPAGADVVCRKATKFRSVVGTGTATLVDGDERRAGLDIIMGHVYGPGPRDYVPEQIEKLLIIRVEIDSLTGKHSGC